MMALWYDCNTTLCHLESRQATNYIIEQTLVHSQRVKQDFEVKKFMLGLTALLVSPSQA